MKSMVEEKSEQAVKSIPYAERHRPVNVVYLIKQELAKVDPKRRKVFCKVDKRNWFGTAISDVRLYRGRVQVYDITVKRWVRPVLVYWGHWVNGDNQTETIYEW